jgi:solute carrier family 25 iron transporter 28/37
VKGNPSLRRIAEFCYLWSIKRSQKVVWIAVEYKKSTSQNFEGKRRLGSLEFEFKRGTSLERQKMPLEEPIDLEWEERDPRKITFLNHVIAGSCAGLTEHVIIFPLDTLKTQLQCERCGSTSPLKTWTCATGMVKREGISRLWRGVGAMFMGCIPAHAAYFSIFEYTKMKLITESRRSLDASQSTMRASICGASSAFAHDLCMTPFDTVKQRMQLGYYKNITDCFKTVIRKEGMGALYLSLPTTLALNIPYGMVMVAVNESAREYLNSGSNQVSLYSSMIAGSLAGAISAAVTNPLDVIKTRLQTQYLEPMSFSAAIPAECAPVVNVHMSSGSAVAESAGTSILQNSKVKGAFQAARQIASEEGLRGFQRGIVTRMMVHAPAVAVSWTAYEAVKQALSLHF